MKISWDEYYMSIAQQVSTRSNCIKRQIGAVLTVDNRIVSTGYNGTPRGVLDCNEGGCARCNDPSIVSGTRLDECWCNHAEENCITQAAYHGVRTKGGTLYTTLSPCITCSKILINAGISTIVYQGEYPQQATELIHKSQVMLKRLN